MGGGRSIDSEPPDDSHPRRGSLSGELSHPSSSCVSPTLKTARSPWPRVSEGSSIQLAAEFGSTIVRPNLGFQGSDASNLQIAIAAALQLREFTADQFTSEFCRFGNEFERDWRRKGRLTRPNLELKPKICYFSACSG